MDVIKVAMNKADKEIQKAGLSDKVHLILQVHDELIYEVEESTITEAKEVIKKIMENAVEFPVPLSVNVAEGGRWGELK